MSTVFDDIGKAVNWVTNLGGGKALPALLAGAGTVGNYLTGRKTNQAISNQIAWDKYVQNLVSNPAAFSKFAQGYTQPLTAGLVQGVENQDQAWLQQHGLSQSPAIAGDVINQSLAPYVQQQQTAGLQAALQALQAGNPGVNPLAGGQGTNSLTGLLKLLQGPQTPQSVGRNPAGAIMQGQPTDINPSPTIDASGTVPDWSTILNTAPVGFNAWGSVPDYTLSDLPFSSVGVPQ